MEVTTKDRLKLIMQERNLRQKDIFDLAQPYCRLYNERLGLADISAYVTGKYLPAQKKLTLLALALNVSEGWLMGLDVPRERLNKSQKKPTREGELERDEFARLFTSLTPENRRRILDLMKVLLEGQVQTVAPHQ